MDTYQKGRTRLTGGTLRKALSLLLLLAAGVVVLEWFRSGSHWDQVSTGVGGMEVSLGSEPGRVCLELFVSRPGPSQSRGPRIGHHSEEVSGDNLWVDGRVHSGYGWRFLGVGYAYLIFPGGQATRIFFAPHWLIAAMLSAYPTLRIWRRWRSRPCGYPTCAQCGYNLTGNVSGICPECGTPIVVSPNGPIALTGQTAGRKPPFRVGDTTRS